MKIKDSNNFSNAEKIALANQLLESDSKIDTTISEEIQKELENRLQLLEEGKTEYYTWDEVKNHLNNMGD